MTAHPEILHPISAKILPRNGWGWLPLVALTASVWANLSADAHWPYTDWLLALALLLGGWRPWWEALAHTDWATPLSQWRTWDATLSTPLLPYTQMGAPGAALVRTVSQARHWWRAVGSDALRAPLRQAGLALALTLLLSAIQGRTTLLLTLLFLAWSELAVLWNGGGGHMGSGWTAWALAGAPWLLGASLCTQDLGMPSAAALALTALVGCHAHASWLAGVGPLIGAAFLIWQGHGAAAGWLLLLALPGLNLLRERPAPEVYQRAIVPWLLGMIGLMAGGQ